MKSIIAIANFNNACRY